MLKKNAKNQNKERLFIIKTININILLVIFIISGGCFQLVEASEIKDFITEGDAWINDIGKEGLTKFDLVIKDESPITINFDGSVNPNYPDERFSFFILTKIEQGLSNLRFTWKKDKIDLNEAPDSLGFLYLTREPSSSSVSHVNSGADFHEIGFDFSNDINYGGAITLNFKWDDFNLLPGPFALQIGINKSDLIEKEVSNVPIPTAFLLFATGLLGLFVRRKQDN